MVSFIWSTFSSQTTGISAQSITAGSNYIGSVIDNSLNKYTEASIDILLNFSVAPVTNTIMEVYLIYSIDGTNYERGDASTDPLKNPIACMPVANATGDQRMTFTGIKLMPLKFKVLLKSEHDQTATATALLYAGSLAVN